MSRLLRALFATLCVVAVGCDSQVATPRPVVLMRPVELTDGLTLTRPEGWSAAVVEIAWGGPVSSRRLGVRFADGRFAIYWPDRTPEPVTVSPPGVTVQALALTPPGLPITGDLQGLTFWELGDGVARILSQHKDGNVTALAPGHESGGPLLVGYANGQINRYVLMGTDQLIGPTATAKASNAEQGVVAIHRVGSDRGWVVTLANHQRIKLESDLKPSTDALVKINPQGGLARARGEASVEIAGRPGRVPPRRWALPGCPLGLDWLSAGGQLAVALPTRLLIIPCSEHGAKPVSLWQELPLTSAVVSVDPVDPEGRRLAIADDSGRIEVLDAEGLIRRSLKFSLDDAAELAFRPWRRLYRPRVESTEAEFPEALARKLDEARKRLDRDPTTDLTGLIRILEADPGLDRHAAAEVAALRASSEQNAGRSIETVIKTLDSAQASFEIVGLHDRSADIMLWKAVLLTPDPDTNRTGDPTRARIVIDEFLATMNTSTHATRARLIAQALLIANDLAEGKITQAEQRLERIIGLANSDPVIAESLDWLNLQSQVALARGNLGEAQQKALAVLNHIPTGEHKNLARSNRLRIAVAAASSGDWSSAIEALDRARPGDAEWNLARVTVRSRANLVVEPSDDPHSEGRRLATGTNRRLAIEPLLRAADLHRHAGNINLAALANLERAEILEKLDLTAEATKAYRAAMQSNQPAVVARTERGLIRIELAANRPLHALAVATHRPDPHVGLDPSEFKLGPTEAILAFTVVSNTSLVGFLIRGGQPLEVGRITLGRLELDRIVRTWRSRLGDGGRGLADYRSPADDLPLGPLAPEPELTGAGPKPPGLPYSWESLLDDVLISRFNAGLIGVSRLTLVLDESLSAMPVEVTGRERRLYRRYELSRATSLDLLLTRPRPMIPSKSVGLPNDDSSVPGIDRSTMAAWKELAGTNGLRVEAGSLESTTLSAFMGRNSVLNSSESGTESVQLRSGSFNDRAIRTRTLIVAGVDPSRGELTSGRSLEQFAHGAILTGSAAVVLPLWKPPDASAPIMIDELQRGLIEGLRPGESLVNARETLARNPKFADPVHWAGYVLYGSP